MRNKEKLESIPHIIFEFILLKFYFQKKRLIDYLNILLYFNNFKFY